MAWIGNMPPPQYPVTAAKLIRLVARRAEEEWTIITTPEWGSSSAAPRFRMVLAG